MPRTMTACVRRATRARPVKRSWTPRWVPCTLPSRYVRLGSVVQVPWHSSPFLLLAHTNARTTACVHYVPRHCPRRCPRALLHMSAHAAAYTLCTTQRIKDLNDSIRFIEQRLAQARALERNTRRQSMNANVTSWDTQNHHHCAPGFQRAVKGLLMINARIAEGDVPNSRWIWMPGLSLSPSPSCNGGCDNGWRTIHRCTERHCAS